MNAYLELASLFISTAFLAVVLSVVGLAVRKVINRYQASRTEAKMNATALVEGARARARSYANAH